MPQLDWHKTLDTLKEALPPGQFHSWFKPVKLLQCNERSVTLEVPSRFHEEWLKSNYAPRIQEAIKDQVGSELQLEFQIVIQDEPTLPLVPQLETSNVTVITERKTEPAPQKRVVEAPNLPQFHDPYVELHFNRVASQMVDLFASGSHSVNPLILVGKVGMGKTHLLTRIGQAIFAKNPQLSIIYVTAEAFTSEMVQSFKDGTILNFKRKYRQDRQVLLLDDIHVLSGKNRTQEELLYIFNDIIGQGGRVAFTCRFSPHKLENIIEPLKSRLLSAVSAEIEPPNFEDRVELLAHLAKHYKFCVPRSVLHTIATRIPDDIRELLGTFLRLHLQAKLNCKDLDSDFLIGQPTIRATPVDIQMDDILTLVEPCYEVTRTEITSKCRTQRVVWARQVAMYLARYHTHLPLEEIGKTFGRDHATVVHAFQKVEQTIRDFPKQAYPIEFLRKKLHSRKQMPKCIEST